MGRRITIGAKGNIFIPVNYRQYASCYKTSLGFTTLLQDRPRRISYHCAGINILLSRKMEEIICALQGRNTGQGYLLDRLDIASMPV